MKYYNDIRDLIGNTPILKLNNISTKEGVNIYAKIEGTSPGGSCKDRVGIYMVEKAEKEGKLKPGSTIIEATAGNTGIGIALAAINKGYKIMFIVPDKFSIEKQKIMKALGAEIINTPKEEGMEGAINLANSLLSEIPNSLSLNQFKNEANPLAHYETTGRELYDGLDGQIDYFVAGAGSGGTISGVLKFLKENISEVKGILADPVGSIIGGGQCGTYKIEGIGNNFIPETMDMSLVDDVIKVNDEEAFDAVKLLAKKEGLIVGSSSGAAFAASLKLAEKIEKGNIENLYLINFLNFQYYAL